MRPHVSVIVDVQRFGADPVAAAQARGEVSPVGQVSHATLERILCDCDLTRIVLNGPSQVLDVGLSAPHPHRRPMESARRPRQRLRRLRRPVMDVPNASHPPLDPQRSDRLHQPRTAPHAMPPPSPPTRQPTTRRLAPAQRSNASVLVSRVAACGDEDEIDAALDRDAPDFPLRRFAAACRSDRRRSWRRANGRRKRFASVRERRHTLRMTTVMVRRVRRPDARAMGLAPAH